MMNEYNNVAVCNITFYKFDDDGNELLNEDGTMTDKEIVQYYGQIWGNVKHMKSYVKELRERYKKEDEDE
jgi:hypothetical protein